MTIILSTQCLFAQNQKIEIIGKVVESGSQQPIGDIRDINEK